MDRQPDPSQPKDPKKRFDLLRSIQDEKEVTEPVKTSSKFLEKARNFLPSDKAKEKIRSNKQLAPLFFFNAYRSLRNLYTQVKKPFLEFDETKKLAGDSRLEESFNRTSTENLAEMLDKFSTLANEVNKWIAIQQSITNFVNQRMVNMNLAISWMETAEKQFGLSSSSKKNKTTMEHVSRLNAADFSKFLRNPGLQELKISIEDFSAGIKKVIRERTRKQFTEAHAKLKEVHDLLFPYIKDHQVFIEDSNHSSEELIRMSKNVDDLQKKMQKLEKSLLVESLEDFANEKINKMTEEIKWMNLVNEAEGSSSLDQDIMQDYEKAKDEFVPNLKAFKKMTKNIEESLNLLEQSKVQSLIKTIKSNRDQILEYCEWSERIDWDKQVEIGDFKPEELKDLNVWMQEQLFTKPLANDANFVINNLIKEAEIDLENEKVTGRELLEKYDKKLTTCNFLLSQGLEDIESYLEKGVQLHKSSLQKHVGEINQYILHHWAEIERLPTSQQEYVKSRKNLVEEASKLFAADQDKGKGKSNANLSERSRKLIDHSASLAEKSEELENVKREVEEYVDRQTKVQQGLTSLQKLCKPFKELTELQKQVEDLKNRLNEGRQNFSTLGQFADWSNPLKETIKRRSVSVKNVKNEIDTRQKEYKTLQGSLGAIESIDKSVIEKEYDNKIQEYEIFIVNNTEEVKDLEDKIALYELQIELQGKVIDANMMQKHVNDVFGKHQSWIENESVVIGFRHGWFKKFCKSSDDARQSLENTNKPQGDEAPIENLRTMIQQLDKYNQAFLQEFKEVQDLVESKLIKDLDDLSSEAVPSRVSQWLESLTNNWMLQDATAKWLMKSSTDTQGSSPTGASISASPVAPTMPKHSVAIPIPVNRFGRPFSRRTSPGPAAIPDSTTFGPFYGSPPESSRNRDKSVSRSFPRSERRGRMSSEGAYRLVGRGRGSSGSSYARRSEEITISPKSMDSSRSRSSGGSFQTHPDAIWLPSRDFPVVNVYDFTKLHCELNDALNRNEPAEMIYSILQSLQGENEAITKLETTYQDNYGRSLEEALRDRFKRSEDRPQLEYVLQLIRKGDTDATCWQIPSFQEDFQEISKRIVEALETKRPEAIYTAITSLYRRTGLMIKLAENYQEFIEKNKSHFTGNLRLDFASILEGDCLRYARYLIGDPQMKTKALNISELSCLCEVLSKLTYITAEGKELPLPHNWLLDGCYGRAHRMAEACKEIGIEVEKIFVVSYCRVSEGEKAKIRGNLRILTELAPNVKHGEEPSIKLGYHVALSVKVQVDPQQSDIIEMIIDPSMPNPDPNPLSPVRNYPLAIDEWMAQMGHKEYKLVDDVAALVSIVESDNPDGRAYAVTTHCNYYDLPNRKIVEERSTERSVFGEDAFRDYKRHISLMKRCSDRETLAFLARDIQRGINDNADLNYFLGKCNAIEKIICTEFKQHFPQVYANLKQHLRLHSATPDLALGHLKKIFSSDESSLEGD